MKVVALLSGGKDSLFNLYLATQEGHEVVAIANLKPPDDQDDELDSYMYQTVGHQALDLIAEALGLPIFRATITGSTENKDLNYDENDQNGYDEVEDLFNLLKSIKEEHKIDYDAISVGAIASSYQKSRCENICKRLDLIMLAYLWAKEQDALLESMIDSKFDAILIKVACMGLGEKHIGQSIKNMQSHLRQLHEQYNANVCGEGGEYESLVLDCPLYKKRLVIDSFTIVCHSKDTFAPVYYMKPLEMHLTDKK